MRYKKIESCRICESRNLRQVFDLGRLSSCGCFLDLNVSESAPIAPLCLMRCTDCGLVQLQHDYDQDNLFRSTYGYRSGLNASMIQHLAGIVASIMKRVHLSSGDYVLDIGSNDATLLKSYTMPGLQRIGIDPSIDQFQSFYPPEIQARADFFTAESFQKIVPNARAKVITSISMFYDLPDPNTFVSDITKVLDPEGIWVLEQSYLPTMLKRNSFDTICHEHLEYYALRQIIDLLQQHQLRVLDVEFNDVNGGNFQVYACHQDASYISNSSKINNILAEEQAMELDTSIPFEAFLKRVEGIKTTLLNFLKNCKDTGKRVHGYGASTKGNTLLQYFGITRDLVEVIADCNATKWGSCTPGTEITIVSEEVSRKMKPDYYLVLPWHFRDSFLVREKNFLDNGGQFIFPLPEFELVGKNDSAQDFHRKSAISETC